LDFEGHISTLRRMEMTKEATAKEMDESEELLHKLVFMAEEGKVDIEMGSKGLQTTSIGGVQIPNWGLVLAAAVIAILLIYSV
jgi:hypothetical protein